MTTGMRHASGIYEIDDERERTDLRFVLAQLRNAYWSKGRDESIVRESIANSVCFNLSRSGRQVGFARVVTDGATVAYLTDFVIHPSIRGQGLGTCLLESILDDPRFRSTSFLLVTRDAMPFYRRSGFESHPFACMRLQRQGVAPSGAPRER